MPKLSNAKINTILEFVHIVTCIILLTTYYKVFIRIISSHAILKLYRFVFSVNINKLKRLLLFFFNIMIITDPFCCESLLGCNLVDFHNMLEEVRKPSEVC